MKGRSTLVRSAVALLVTWAFALAAFAAAPPADPVAAELKAAAAGAIAQLSQDPPKGDGLHFDKPEHARLLVPLLGKTAGGWKRLKGLIAEKRLGEPAEPAAVAFVQFPLETPAWFEHATRSGQGDAFALADDTEGSEIQFRKRDGRWTLDASAQLELKGEEDVARLSRYLTALASALEKAAKDVGAGNVASAKAAAAAVDRHTCLQLVSRHLTDGGSQPAPPAAGEERRLVERSGRLTSLAVLPDGKGFVTGATAAASPLRVRDFQGKLLREFSAPGAEVIDVHAVALSPDGKRLAVNGLGYSAASLLHALRSGDPAKPFEWASQSHGVWLFDLESGKEVIPLQRPEGQLGEPVAYSHDGKLIAAAGVAGSLLWDVETGKIRHKLPPAESVAFSPTGELAIRYYGPTLGVIDPATGQERRSFKLSDERADTTVGSLGFSPDGKTIAYGTFTGVILLDAESGREIQRLRLPDGGGINRVNGFVFSRDGSRLLGCSGLYSLDDDNHNRGLAALVRARESREVCLWDVRTGRLLKKLRGHTRAVSGVAFIDDERRAVSSSTDGTVRIWSLSAP